MTNLPLTGALLAVFRRAPEGGAVPLAGAEHHRPGGAAAVALHQWAEVRAGLETRHRPTIWTGRLVRQRAHLHTHTHTHTHSSTHTHTHTHTHTQSYVLTHVICCDVCVNIIHVNPMCLSWRELLLWAPHSPCCMYYVILYKHDTDS